MTSYFYAMRHWCVALIFSVSGVAYAGTSPPKDIGQLALNLLSQFGQFNQLMLGIAYLGGIGFFISAIFKFKQYKENPTQIPVGTPFSLLGLAILLLFLPGLIIPAAKSLFGSGSDTAEASGGLVGGYSSKVISGLPGGVGGVGSQQSSGGV